MTAKRGARKQAIHKGERGPGAKRTRPPRMNNLPVDDDEQTRVEAEIAGSGRTDLRPREGLAGARQRRGPRATRASLDAAARAADKRPSSQRRAARR